MSAKIKAPDFAPELQEFLANAPPMPIPITLDHLPGIRPYIRPDAAQLIGDRPITVEDVQAPGLPGEPEVTLSILRPANRAATGPLVYFLHMGGLIMGNRFFGLQSVLDWVDGLGATLVTAEYRLAPEHPYPAASDDAYAGLLWVAAHAGELGHDPEGIVVAGASAGGGLAAATVLRARDGKGLKVAGQMLIYPMLDDRDQTVSNAQYDGFGRWDRGSNNTGWSAYLGEWRGQPDVPAYAAPSRATDLSGLPPTFLDAGSAELFRDEIVAYASQIWADGGDCELHVWPGGFHSFDIQVPGTAMSVAMVEARRQWLIRKFRLDVTS